MKSNSLLMTAMILLLSFTSKAQTSLGIMAGASFANVKISSGGFSASPKMKMGLTAGLMLDAPLSKDFHFQPGLNFVQKGYKAKDDLSKETFTINYLELPLNFVYYSNGFFAGAGPYVAYGTSGTDKTEYTDGSTPDDKEKIKFGSGEEEVKSMDLGANFTAGYKTKSGFLITANYTLGLSNIGNTGADGSAVKETIKNNCFGIKVGYMFGGSHKK
jgi:hypothetical protein